MAFLTSLDNCFYEEKRFELIGVALDKIVKSNYIEIAVKQCFSVVLFYLIFV